MDDRLSGVLCPVITPYDANLDPDGTRLARQCEWLLTQNVGLAIFGTNSEANSLSADEKVVLLDQVVEAGIDTGRMMPGTGCCALTDTVTLTAHATKLGCAGVLLLPPFYYKDVTDDGIYASVAETIQRVGDDALRIYLYHIPPIAQVGYSVDLIERLVTEYPETIVGLKDSSGDLGNMTSLLESFPGFGVYAGTERYLLPVLQAGGPGCISATANVTSLMASDVFRAHEESDNDAGDLQERLTAVRKVFDGLPLVAALKEAMTTITGRRGWQAIRPPLTLLAPAQKRELQESLHAEGFNLKAAA